MHSNAVPVAKEKQKDADNQLIINNSQLIIQSSRANLLVNSLLVYLSTRLLFKNEKARLSHFSMQLVQNCR